MKTKMVAICLVILLVMLAGCDSSKQLLEGVIDESEVDEVQFVMAMGNPEYGAESRIITDKDEVIQWLDCLNHGKIGDKVPQDDIGIGENYKLYIRNDGHDIYVFQFKGPGVIWYKSDWYYIDYDGLNPFELYRDSVAMMTVVDDKLKPVKRPFPKVSSELILSVTPDMIYRDIIELLGYSENIGSGVIVLPYIVDDHQVLKISLFGLEEPCQVRGEELLMTLEALNRDQ